MGRMEYIAYDKADRLTDMKRDGGRIDQRRGMLLRRGKGKTRQGIADSAARTGGEDLRLGSRGCCYSLLTVLTA